MLVEDDTSNHISKLVASLEALISASSKRVEKKHEFRTVSAAKATPYSLSFASWERNGRVGPQPNGTSAEIRAALYALAETASELRAFLIVTNVVMVELAEAAIVGLRDGRIVVAFTTLRGLIERIALAAALADDLTRHRQVNDLRGAERLNGRHADCPRLSLIIAIASRRKSSAMPSGSISGFL